MLAEMKRKLEILETGRRQPSDTKLNYIRGIEELLSVTDGVSAYDASGSVTDSVSVSDTITGTLTRHFEIEQVGNHLGHITGGVSNETVLKVGFWQILPARFPLEFPFNIG